MDNKKKASGNYNESEKTDKKTSLKQNLESKAKISINSNSKDTEINSGGSKPFYPEKKQISPVLYSKKYREHYKSTTLGLYESFLKFIIPSFETKKSFFSNDEIVVFDDCFGYGYNTLALIYYSLLNLKNKKLKIISFELDSEIISKLSEIRENLEESAENSNFYEDILGKSSEEMFDKSIDFLNALTSSVVNVKDYSNEANDKEEFVVYHNAMYVPDNDLSIELFVVNENLLLLRNLFSKKEITDIMNLDKNFKFDFVFHDPFSRRHNPELWSKEFFSDLIKFLGSGSVLTTYSCAKSFRNLLSEKGFENHDVPAYGRRSPSTLSIFKDD